jgi:putative aldouronate transport system permease protein
MKKEALPAAGPVSGVNEMKTYSKKTRVIRENLELWSFVIPAAVMIIMFNYLPMYGIIIAFQAYFPGAPFLSETTRWIGFQNFSEFIAGEYFLRIVGNSVYLSLLNLAFGFWLPIIFALILNEIRNEGFKKFVQTASYLPYFISMVVVAGMAISFLQPTGIVNMFLGTFGIPPTSWLDKKDKFAMIYTIINVWKGFGFGSVLYFSTMSAINPSLYESARIDGANRWAQCWHITLPGLKSIIAIQFILALGGILGANSDLIILIYTPATYETADVIGSYTYRMGIVNARYSYTTAVGLFMSAIGFGLTFIANKFSNWLTGFGLW